MKKTTVVINLKFFTVLEEVDLAITTNRQQKLISNLLVEDSYYTVDIIGIVSKESTVDIIGIVSKEIVPVITSQ